MQPKTSDRSLPTRIRPVAELFARVARLHGAVELMRRDRVASLAELASECGYADQAYLTRDFCEFAGSPPAAFLRRKLPDEGGFVD